MAQAICMAMGAKKQNGQQFTLDDFLINRELPETKKAGTIDDVMALLGGLSNGGS